MEACVYEVIIILSSKYFVTLLLVISLFFQLDEQFNLAGIKLRHRIFALFIVYINSRIVVSRLLSVSDLTVLMKVPSKECLKRKPSHSSSQSHPGGCGGEIRQFWRTLTIQV